MAMTVKRVLRSGHVECEECFQLRKLVGFKAFLILMNTSRYLRNIVSNQVVDRKLNYKSDKGTNYYRVLAASSSEVGTESTLVEQHV